MALLTGAITALTLGGTPGLPAWTDTSGAASARPYVETFTRLAPSGTAGRPYGTFTKIPNPAVERPYSVTFTRLAPHGTPTELYGTFSGKVEKTQDEKYVTDTIRVFVTEGPVSDVDIDVNEIFLPRVLDGRSLGVGRVASDTIRPRITDVVQFLQKGGSVAKSASDTIVPVLAEGAVYRAQIAVSEAIVPVITDGASVQKVDIKYVVDTITVVLDETKVLNTSLAARSFSVTDTIAVRLSEVAGNANSGEVDIIRIIERPYGIIRITEI